VFDLGNFHVGSRSAGGAKVLANDLKRVDRRIATEGNSQTSKVNRRHLNSRPTVGGTRATGRKEAEASEKDR